MKSMNIHKVILLASIGLGLSTEAIGSTPGQRRRTKLPNLIDEVKKQVLNLGKCTAVSVYEHWQNEEWRCTDWRLIGNCVVPGYPGTDCPRLCNTGHWVTISKERGAKISEEFVNCVTQ